MTPHEAYRKAYEAGKRLPELEDIILADLIYSVFYAEDVIKGRWIEAEDTIMNSSSYDAFYYTMYAMWVIKGKLPDKMHNMILLHAIENPNDQYVKGYFKYIK